MAPIDIARTLFTTESLSGGLRHARMAVRAAGPDLARFSAHHLQRRALSVNSTQKVTLGVIAAYTVIIALLWNIPYIRWSLWPFKVSAKNIHCHMIVSLMSTDACDCLPRIWTCFGSLLYWRTRQI